VVSAGTAGVTVSAGCGSSTFSCTLFVTPVGGQAGTATVTFSVRDGADRAAQAQLTLTSTDPGPATSNAGNGSTSSTSSATAGTGGGHGGGGAVPGWLLLCLGILVGLKIERQLHHA
jgi:hypothetical protein